MRKELPGSGPHAFRRVGHPRLPGQAAGNGARACVDDAENRRDRGRGKKPPTTDVSEGCGAHNGSRADESIEGSHYLEPIQLEKVSRYSGVSSMNLMQVDKLRFTDLLSCPLSSIRILSIRGWPRHGWVCYPAERVGAIRSHGRSHRAKNHLIAGARFPRNCLIR